jgi:ATP-dependent helicase/nuclease subunit A
MTLASSPDTESRQRAATALDSTILVEAGAGSGKTAVLTSRLLSLLRSGRGRIDRVAAITFSDKAATEMRLRLRTELDLALAGPLPEDERTNLRIARLQLDRAHISTIHAFCATLLRERSVEARIDPDFTVLDAVETSLLQTELWRTWLMLEMDRSPTALKHALQAKLSLAHLETLRDFLVAQRDCLDWLPAPVEVPLPELQTCLSYVLPELNALKASCSNPSDRAVKAIRRVATLLPIGGDDKAWERLLLREPREVFANPTVGAKTNWQPASALHKARALLTQLSEVYSRTRAAWFHNLTVGLAHWLEGYLHAYREKKQECSQLDFTDLLINTRNLLKTNLDARRYFQRKFDVLCVDELQDTDPLQAEIVFFLAEREARAQIWTEVELHPGKLFLVGDPQQAIYHFRRADVDVYSQVRTAIERQGEVLTLSANFRTRAPVLTWINETFTRAFAEGGSVQPPYRPLAATRQESTGREVILLPVPRALLSATGTREEQRVAEARTVASFLKQTMTYHRLEVWGDRQVRYRDIAILFRTYQAIDIYEDALRSAGIPYRIFGGRRYSRRPEIEECRALLLAIERPSETGALVAALRSSAFGFSDEELALFACAGGTLDYMHEDIPDALPTTNRFRAAFALLRDLHLHAAQGSPAMLLSVIYDRTPMIPVFALHPHGTQRVANLLKLVDLARVWSARGLYTLAAFNRFLAHQDLVEEEPEAVVTEEHEDAVRLLTIHKAKGLEFPVVVLADMASSRQGRGGRAVGIVERGSETLELHIGPRTLTCTTQGWQKAEAREQARDAAEEQRLWYVAAARVRDYLIVPQRPRATLENDGAQPPVINESEDRGTTATLFSQTDHIPMYVYESDPHIIEQTMAGGASPVQSLHIPPHVGALHGYEQWRNKRRITLIPEGERTIASVAPVSSPLPQPTTDTVRRVIQEALRQVLTEQQGMGETPGHRLTTTPRYEMARLVNLLRTSHLLHRARMAAEHAVALPFVLTFEHQTFTGEIDLVFTEFGVWVFGAFDFSESAPNKAPASELRSSLTQQAVALEQLTGRPVRELVILNIQTQNEQSFLWNDEVRQQFPLPPVVLPCKSRDT